MGEVKLAYTNSDERGVQEVRTQMDPLSELRNQILQLLCNRLSDNSILVMQEELQLMQRSSYYLEVHSVNLLPTADEQQYTVWYLTDPRRKRCAMTLANTQVRLLLSFLGLLYKEIIRGCRELEAFIKKYDQGLVDSEMAASMRKRLQQTQQYMYKFESRLTRNLRPLDLQNMLIPNTGIFPMQQFSASLAIKMPVVFKRLESRATSNSVHLSWEIAGKQSNELNQQFEIHVTSLHPTVAEPDQFSISTCQSYNIQFTNLTPDTCYMFSVKRADAVNLVYELWSDSIMLKTLDISK
ncbi:fibronectin type III domain-containing protein 11-like [Centropristis striata]|uniref:fibronectin type III domain-containing protein 11-like n=1 Tax=Centropristis striata TaxID=184440 RepID=UPI0027DED7B1|nr:fibronectin type III domain-containing protein 11-like [Centropristis striata]